MKYATQYLKQAIKLLDGYDGLVPLQHYLKSTFSAEKKYGSKDRKFLSHLCYSYFRLGHFIKNINAEERIKVALFLLADDNWKDVFEQEWLPDQSKSIQDKIALVEEKYQQKISSIFPWQKELSDGIDDECFTRSHLFQPKLFIRIRPGAGLTVSSKLNKAEMPYEQITDHCLAFNNATKLENVLEINKEYVVQDMSSQNVGKLLTTINYQPPTKVWDCCAASGGKSIMAYDMIPNIQLSVSDIRPSILHNLKGRFIEAGIETYKSFVADLTKPINQSTNQLYDLIICDAPCTGSGTWSRTPEQLYFFKEHKITRYNDLQKRIVSNVIPSIKQGGLLLYITCSVFKKENEEVAGFILEQFDLTLIKMETLKGYDSLADTMFAALFQKKDQ